ncbi:MAG: winged helix-turn-helix transcriptional regulator [bacterium]|nr:winged helix-turn-helix transcriptional regulator [bacterium]
MRTRDKASGALAGHLHPEIFRALSDETRLHVLGRLAAADGPVTVTQVADCCGVHLSGVSRHLSILRAAGLVTSNKRGREVFYTLRSDVLTGTLRGLADAIESCRASCGAAETGACS